jgi:hypothetical protein
MLTMRQRDDGDVPPAVKCAVCGLVDCAGCGDAVQKPVSADAAIAWESASGTFHQRLWRTALAASVVPARTFGELPDGRIGPALSFAFAAEAVAIGSLFAVVSLVGWVLAPDLWLRLAQTPAVVGSCVALVVSATTAMVALHALWGVCLELGARAGAVAPKFRHGVRFGLYACGWDLLTSPAGLLEGVVSRGPRRAWGPIADAVRVPRRAMRAYVELCRKLSPEAQRRGERLSLLVLGGAMLTLIVVAVGAALWFAARVG